MVTVCYLSLGMGGMQCGDCLFSFFGEGRSESDFLYVAFLPLPAFHTTDIMSYVCHVLHHLAALWKGTCL